MPTRRVPFFLLFVLLIAACGDDDTGEGACCAPIGSASAAACDVFSTAGASLCSSSGDGDSCRWSTEARCELDAGPADGGRDTNTPDGGMDAPQTCESALFCGSPPICCAEGQECLDAMCVAACASGVRCADTCCGDAEVCVSGTCSALGDECEDSYDCALGGFCEPTLSRCLPQFEPVTCSLEPSFDAFEPVLEWSSGAFDEYPNNYASTVMPLVINLDDDPQSEVIVSYFNGPCVAPGVLRVHDGVTGEVQWAIQDVDGSAIAACPTNAVADIDLDGDPEIVVFLLDGRLAALSTTGEVEWTSTNAMGEAYELSSGVTFANVAIAIGDLVPGGTPEIAAGGIVLSGEGRLLWSTPLGVLEGDNNGYVGGLPLMADIDLDGQMELVTGHNAYENDGTLLWSAAMTDGYPAVGNFDEDPQPEVVLVSHGTVALIDGISGEIQWGPIDIPGGGRGGPPTVADFDGDGRREIGVAGARFYSVFDPAADEPVLWSMATQDLSSNATGSAVFDFEGDGAAEVVYADERFLRAYRGSDGTELFAIPNISGTQHEYPVTVDVDGDGNTEIIIIANGAPPNAGVFVYGDAHDRWVPTRRIWNQHTYHVTNVSSSGTVASPERDNWSSPELNNYRQNVQGAGVFNAPDLYIAGISVNLSACPTSLRLQVIVANEGNLGVLAGVEVQFYYGTPASRGAHIGTVVTDVPLLPGASTTLELVVALEESPPFEFVVVVDEVLEGATGESAVAECDEDDNVSAIGEIDCALLI